jgi:hypothetical protein
MRIGLAFANLPRGENLELLRSSCCGNAVYLAADDCRSACKYHLEISAVGAVESSSFFSINSQFFKIFHKIKCHKSS